MEVQVNSRFYLIVFALAIIVAIGAAQDSSATKVVTPGAGKDSSTTKHVWKFLAEPYLMFPYMKGTIGIGALPDAQVNANPGDIFSHLHLAAMLYLEAGNDQLAFTSDVIYMDLKQDVASNTVINSGSVNAKQFAWEIAGLYKIAPSFDAGIGGRINNIQAGVDIIVKNIGGGTTSHSASILKSWVDPIIIARFKNDPAERIIYQLRADVGGFGVGSKLAWQLQGYAGYRFSDLFQMTAGYRIISMDYDKESGQDRFLYDVNTFGPVLKFGFNF